LVLRLPAQQPARAPVHITANFENQHLLEVFQQLEAEYPLRFFYREEWIPRTAVQASFEDTPVQQVLEKLLANTRLDFLAYDAHTYIIARKLDLLELDAFSFETFVEQVEALDQQPQQQVGRRLIIGDSTLRPLPASARLRGYILDQATEEPLPGGQISFPALGIGTFSDADGAYALEVPAGKHLARVEAPGHETLSFEVWVFSDDEQDIALGYTAYQLDEVLLEAGAKGQSLDNAQAGRVQLSMIDVRRTPALMGEVDIINTILLLPGVSTVGESASGFNVRGGNIDQNLIMQDGQMLFNSSHMLGFFSVINPDIVQNVTLYKGHIPAQYGGRISSVLDVDIMDGSYRKYKGQGNLGLFSSKLAVSGPIQPGKNSFVAAIRAAYPNLLTRNIEHIKEVRLSSSYYGDLSLKLTQKLSEKGKLSFFGYASKDFFSFTDEFGFEWSTFSGGLEWQHIYSERMSVTLDVDASRFSSSFFNTEGATGARHDTGVDNLSGKFDLQLVPTRQHNIHAGIETHWYDVHPNVVSPSGENSSLIPLTIEKDQALELALYLNDDFDLNPFIRFSAGLRLSHFRNMGPFVVRQYTPGLERRPANLSGQQEYGRGETIASFTGVEPRLAVRFLLDEASSVKLSYNRINQYLHLLSNTASPTPIDVWQLSNTYFPAQRAHNFSLGFFKNFKGKIWQTSIEFFYRDMQGLVVAKDFARLLGNEHIETEMLNAVGRAYGAELSIKRTYGKLDVEAAFTYSRSLRRTAGNPENQHVNEGAWFPSDFDSPYNVSLTAKYRPSRTKTFSASFIYRRGRPITAPAGAFAVYPSWFIPTFSERNSLRIPDYHRLDVSYTFDDGLISRRQLKTEFTFSLYNVYARQNAFSVFFRKEGSQFKSFKLAVLGTVLPFVSYNFKF